jgi:hypothetical protein
MGGAAAGASILRDMLQRAPTVMFVLLPVFALILKLLYIRSGRFYVEHFVFALRYHAFAFVLFTIMLPLENTWIPALLTIWLIVYLPLAMKHVYRQGWFATGVKFVLLSTADLIVLVIGLTVTLILALLLA